MRSSRRRVRGAVEANLTPLVDVVFLLIIFFVLVAQLTSAEQVELPLPRLAEAATIEQPRDRRIIINVLPPETPGADGYAVGAARFADSPEGLAQLTELMQRAVARDPQVEILLRAARHESYARAYAALRACREAGAPRVNLVAEAAPGNGQ